MQSYMHMHCQARQLDSYSSARHCSTARQLLDRPRQTSTELDAQAHGVRLDRLDSNSTVTRQARQARPRQRLDSGASTEPRQLDSSTARAQYRITTYIYISIRVRNAYVIPDRIPVTTTRCVTRPPAVWGRARLAAPPALPRR
jgi:hypothetical protein